MFVYLDLSLNLLYFNKSDYFGFLIIILRLFHINYLSSYKNIIYIMVCIRTLNK